MNLVNLIFLTLGAVVSFVYAFIMFRGKWWPGKYHVYRVSEAEKRLPLFWPERIVGGVFWVCLGVLFVVLYFAMQWDVAWAQTFFGIMKVLAGGFLAAWVALLVCQIIIAAIQGRKRR